MSAAPADRPAGTSALREACPPPPELAGREAGDKPPPSDDTQDSASSSTSRRRSSFFANPLAAKELRGRMRGPRPFVVATLYLLPLGALTLGLYALIAGSTTGNVASGAPVGKLFFAAVSALELGLICLLAPALTADLISGERERRTYDLLLVTPLSRGQIVVGKLVAGLGALLLLVVLALPLQAVAILLGGVGADEIAVGFGILVLTAVTYGCVGLYWSARLRTTRAAVAFAYGTTVLGVLGLPLAAIIAVLGSQLFGLSGFVPGMLLGRTVFEGPAEAQLLATLGQLLIATNPPLSGIFSATVLTQGEALLFDDTFGGQDVTYVAPWLLFIVVHLLAIMALVLLTGRALRPRR